MINDKKLQAKIECVNLINKVIDDQYDVLSSVFQPYVGQKVFKADGSLLKKIHDGLSDLKILTIHYYRMNSIYSLAWTYRTSIFVDGIYDVFYEKTLYIGNVQNGILTDLLCKSENKSDYTFEKVLDLLLVAQNTKKIAEEALEKARPFDNFI